MKRVVSIVAGVVLLIAASVVPVAADTTRGGNQLQSFSTTCVDAICTDTNIFAFADPSEPTACVDFVTSIDKTFLSDERGGAPAPSFTISSTLAASFGATSIPLEICDETGCTPSRTV